MESGVQMGTVGDGDPARGGLARGDRGEFPDTRSLSGPRPHKASKERRGREPLCFKTQKETVRGRGEATQGHTEGESNPGLGHRRPTLSALPVPLGPLRCSQWVHGRPTCVPSRGRARRPPCRLKTRPPQALKALKALKARLCSAARSEPPGTRRKHEVENFAGVRSLGQRQAGEGAGVRRLRAGRGGGRIRDAGGALLS